MRVITFKPEFASLVLHGGKRQTIRRRWKRPPEFGELLSLRMWTGRPYYSRQREIKKATLSAFGMVEMIEDTEDICVDGRVLSPRLAENFAMADGFKNKSEMFSWFSITYGTIPDDLMYVQWSDVDSAFSER